MTKGRLQLPFLLLVVLAGSLGERPVLAAAAEQGSAGEDDLYKQLAVYSEVLALVGRGYVDETDAATLVLSSLEGAIDAADPFSLYIPPQEVDAYLAARSAPDRSGLLILKERGVAYVVAVDEGSPAERAGIESGQIVEKLQGRGTRAMPIWRIRQLLGAPAGTAIEMELLGGSAEEYIVGFELAEFEEPRPHLKTSRGLPILRIPGFSARTPADVDELLLGREEGSLIIDLRGVAGGDPEAAYGVAERFAAGDLGTLAGRHGAIRRFAGPVPPIWSGRLALLVNRGTQGAAEVLATVLRQACGARLVGERTFGFAGKTESIGLSSGARLELTGAFYSGPDAEPLHKSLEPDLSIRPRSALAAGEETDQSESDEALEQAIDLLLQDDS